MVGVLLQVIGLLMAAAGLWCISPAGALVVVGAAFVMFPHYLAADEPERERVP